MPGPRPPTSAPALPATPPSPENPEKCGTGVPMGHRGAFQRVGGSRSRPWPSPALASSSKAMKHRVPRALSRGGRVGQAGSSVGT